MNTQLQTLAVIDDYISFIWTSRYYSCGDFELCVNANPTNAAIFQKDYFIYREDDDNIGVVEDIKFQTNEDGQEIMLITGRFLSSIIDRRVISRRTIINSNLITAIRTMLNNEIINPSDSARKIANLTFQSLVTSNVNIESQFTGKNLLDTIADLCMTYEIGFKTILTNDNKFQFTLYEGTDRSYAQDVNPYVVFSDQYDNLLTSEYEENYTNIVTNVLVGGEGEGEDRILVWSSKGNQTGLNRHELFKDAKSLADYNELSEAEYRAQLLEIGKEDLNTFTQAFTGTVYFENIAFREDVFVGDICTIEKKNWGLHINSRLVEVIESVSETGEYSIIPTFGI